MNKIGGVTVGPFGVQPHFEERSRATAIVVPEYFIMHERVHKCAWVRPLVASLSTPLSDSVVEYDEE